MPSDATTGATGEMHAQTPQQPDDARLQRALKISIAVMSVLIVAGLFTVGGRIIYLASQKDQQSSSVASAQVVGASRMVSGAQLALPVGASVRAMALSGDRLAVHYDAPTGAGIAILDLTTGRPATRIEIVPAAAGN